MKGIDVSTKILTEKGWKLYDELTGNDRISVISMNKEIMYEKIAGMNLEEYEGELYTIENRWNDFFIPPESSLILKYIKCGTGGTKYSEDEWHEEKVKDITPHGGFNILNSGIYNGENSIGELQAMLIGWIISLGFKNYEEKIEINQSMELAIEDFAILLEIVNSLNVEHEYSVNEKMTIDDEHPFKEQTIKILPVESNKWIYEKFTDEFKPKWELLHIKHNELEMLFEGMNISNNAYFENELITYINNDIDIQEFYRVLCLHLGYVTNFVKKRRAYASLTTQVHEKNFTTIFHVNYHDIFKKIEHYKGTFWYPKITHKHFVVQRNEKIFVVGV
jgi:uncharacterized pyridoxamine 5'-phosphate oxidase family protein